MNILLFGLGVIVTFLLVAGIYQSRKEKELEWESQRKSKLSYRTNQEFIE